MRLAAKCYMLTALSWDYVDTILDMCVSMKRKETKLLSREVRQVKRDYEQFRSRSIDEAASRDEINRAIGFEDFCKKHLSTLTLAIGTETARFSPDAESKIFIQSVYHAMTMLETVRLYGEYVDSRIEAYGISVPYLAIIESDFTKLFSLIPKFAGKYYLPNLSCVSLTAKILVKKMHEVKLSDEHGEL